jgi:hypothetical protein
LNKIACASYKHNSTAGVSFDNDVYNSLYNARNCDSLSSFGYYHINLYKNGKGKKYTIRQLFYICNPIENINFVDIPNYEGLYKFDNELLQVYNIKTDKYLKNGLTTDGYYQVGLFKNRKTQTYKIHRLNYIINNPTDDISLLQIDHIDNNRTNNKIENLRVATRSDNCSNRKTMINNKLGIKYIRKTKYNTYEFHLCKNKIHYYKCFKTLEESIEHRDRVVLEKCGEFTNLG